MHARAEADVVQCSSPRAQRYLRKRQSIGARRPSTTTIYTRDSTRGGIRGYVCTPVSLASKLENLKSANPPGRQTARCSAPPSLISLLASQLCIACDRACDTYACARSLSSALRPSPRLLCASGISFADVLQWYYRGWKGHNYAIGQHCT